ncbi:hypothetical protein Hanom_Chr02g00135051 [Helianthus anomalus]
MKEPHISLPQATELARYIFIFKAQSQEPFCHKKRGWLSRGAHDRRKRMKKLQKQRAIAKANREMNAQPRRQIDHYGRKSLIGSFLISTC